MSDNDISKMKVSDLRRELKLRGLAFTGNKNELQDRLQTALIDGDLLLDDPVISGEDLEDSVLTDEDEAKILCGDENELLASPASKDDLKLDDSKSEDTILSLDSTSANAKNVVANVPKKVVLKRECSLITTIAPATISKPEPEQAKENSLPEIPKMKNNHKRIVIDSSDAKIDSSNGDVKDKTIKQLTLKERLELRAQKFGIKAQNESNNKLSNDTAPKLTVDNEKQIEVLKKRAERFGCVTSSIVANLDAKERLLKRKQRFAGSVAAPAADNASISTTTGDDGWEEKKKQRLERFKSAAAASSTTTTVDNDTN